MTLKTENKDRINSKAIRLLLIDDDEDDFVLTKDLLMEIPGRNYTIDWMSSFDDAISIVEKKQYDIYLVDYRLGKNTGIDFLHQAIKLGCKDPIIILTGKGDQKIDIETMKSGASDYLVKDKIDAFILERAIRYAIDRSRAVETIKESETKYRNIFEKSRDVIYIADSSGNFLDINASATKIFNFSRKEFLKLKVKQLFADSHSVKAFEKFLDEKDELKDFEATLLTASGEKIYCLLSTSLQLDNNGELEYFQGIIHDITKRKIAEQRLMNYEKLAVSGRIARAIAHEVRNPLTNVNLALEQIKIEINSSDETLDLFFNIISRNSERINQLITELLNSSKPATLQKQKISVNKLLEASLNLAMDRIKLKGIQVEKNYGTELSEISLDEEKVKTALLNIIINAVEAMVKNQGILKLRTEFVDNRCIINIIDNGSGINPEDKNKLFDPFFSGKPEGMGLGLTTAQNIILSHNGLIDVESEVGKGTGFAISFNLS